LSRRGFAGLGDRRARRPEINPKERSCGDSASYDKQGNIARTILSNFNQRYSATATGPGPDAKTLSTNYPSVIITLYENNQQALRIELGLRNAYGVPGAGVVLLDAGRVVIDRTTGDVLSQSGQHQFLNGDGDAFCDYFAGP
jgi:hypothetical protein